MIVAINIPEKVLRQALPKHGLTLEETNSALGSESLVVGLRRIGALKPAVKMKQTLLFDAGEVARVWTEVRAGKYDSQLGLERGAA